LLEPYLAQHPVRLAALWRAVPEVQAGLRGHWRLRQGKLELVRLSVEGVQDPLVGLVAWHALFPGLRGPLVPWWLHGRWLLTDMEKMPDNPPGVFVTYIWEDLELDLKGGMVAYRGPVRPVPPKWSEADPFDWALWRRLLLLPLMLAALLASLVWLPWRGYREGRPFPWTFAMEGPVFALLFLLAWMSPVRLQRRILRKVVRIGERYRVHWSVRGLVKEAFAGRVDVCAE